MVSASLRAVEWPDVLEVVSRFAATHHGRTRIMDLEAPCDAKTSRRLAMETRGAMLLESLAAEGGGVTFAPADTRAAEAAVALARKGGLLTAETSVRVRDAAEVAARLKRLLEVTMRAARGDDAELLAVLATNLELVEPLDALCDGVRRIIDDELMEVRESFSPALRSARSNMRKARQRIERAATAAGGAAAAAGGALVERDGRMLLSVPAEAAGRGALANARQMGTAAGGAALVELPAFVAMNDALASATAAALEEERRALAELTSLVRANADALDVALDAIGALDAACCRARYGAWSRGVVADVRERGERGEGPYKMRLDGLAHPLLLAARLDAIAERRKQRRDGGDAIDADTVERTTIVRNDVRVPRETHAAVLTGPNTGGKTSLLKAVALACLSAHAGIPVPCAREPAVVPHLRHVLADIGDEQSLAASLSTFSAHATRIAAIFDAVLAGSGGSGASLVLLDELGTGTEPAAGAALGAAVLRALADGFRDRGEASIVLATTHQGDLKALKYEGGVGEAGAPAHIENACVEFDEKKMRPTYQLLWGVPGRSHGLNVARTLGLESGVVDGAAARLGDEHEAANAVVATLEGALAAYRRDIAAAQESLRRTRLDIARMRTSNASMYESEVSRRRSRMEDLQKAFRVELEALSRQSQRARSPPPPATEPAAGAATAPLSDAGKVVGKKKKKKLAAKQRRLAGDGSMRGMDDVPNALDAPAAASEPASDAASDAGPASIPRSPPSPSPPPRRSASGGTIRGLSEVRRAFNRSGP